MIQLILTGGTIGSELRHGIISTAARPPLLARIGGAEDFRILTPFTVLSENMTFARLTTLRETVSRAAAEKDAEGIIIAHGTDTLSFTAAYLALSLPGIDLPVVLVSSDYPLSDPRANGMENFSVALRFIREAGRPGVYAAYKNPGEPAVVHYGTRLLEARSFDGAYYSAAGKTAAVLGPEGFTLSEAGETATPAVSLGRLRETVLWIKPYVGMDYDRYDPLKAAAVLHDSFHAGTVNRAAFDRFVSRCPAPVYLAGGSAGTTYASQAGLTGVRVYDNIAPVALYIKLSLACSNGLAGDETYLKTNTAHEFF